MAREMEAFMNQRTGRCSWKKTAEVISELFEGEKAYKDMGITVDPPNLKWPQMTPPEQAATTPGEKRICVSPTRVRRPKYGEKGGFRGAMVRRLSLPARLEAITVDLCNASLPCGTWRCYESGERAAMRCERETGISMAMPWGESQLQQSASTRIKSAHMRCGLPVGAWDSFILKAVMRGRQNTEAPRKQKVPMSPGLMMMLREKINHSNMMAANKAVIWAVAAVQFEGRGGHGGQGGQL